MLYRFIINTIYNKNLANKNELHFNLSKKLC